MCMYISSCELCSGVAILPLLFWTYLRDRRYFASVPSEPISYHIIGDEDGMATIGTLGRVDEFDIARDDWPQYVERLEHFFVANGIGDVGKK